jgi:outer membrane protein assembly factor BamB
MIRAFFLILLLAPAVRAQTPGEVLWTVDIGGFSVMGQPRVAADGTIYLVTNQLYAISPGGEILWTAPAFESYVDVGPDGTVYTAGGNTIYAYHPDGTLRWNFTESPQGQGIMQGPTLGPDGNLYAISDLGGLGAFSLTPQGQLRWNVPGFSNNTGTGLGRVQFGSNNLYFAEDWSPGCAPLTSGLASITLDGVLDWCIPISGVSRPRATLDGLAVTWQGGVSGKTLFAYNPDGHLVWTYTFDFSPVAIGSVEVGPDNNVYAFHSITKLASLTAGGDERWEQDQPLGNFPWRAAVAPDLSAVVSGSVYGFGNNGAVVAASPADGQTLWSVPITGPSAGAGAPAEFSPEGGVVYVPVHTLDFDVPDQLWAIRVRTGETVSVEPAPGRLALSAAHPNPFSAATAISLSVPDRQSVGVEVYDALGRRVAVLHEGTLAAGAGHRFTFDAAGLPAGLYLVRATGETFSETRRVTLLR